MTTDELTAPAFAGPVDPPVSRLYPAREDGGMPQAILHKDGAYQLYTTVADGPCYEQALTLEELTEILRFEGGQAAIDALPGRLERAHKTGCSAHGYTLEECIAGNRAGPNESEVPFAEFVRRWLTLPANVAGNRLARQGQSELTGVLGPNVEN